MSPVSAARYIVPLAKPPAAPFELPFAACSLYLENPSGVWYDVAGFTVPPWTWGLIVRLDVPAPSFRVQLLPAAPDALVSEVHGGPLLVIAYETALAPSLGRSLYPVPHEALHRELDVDIPDVQVRDIVLVPAVAAHRIVPLWSGVHASSGYAGRVIRGLVEVSLYFLDAAGADVQIADHSLSPALPHPPAVPIGRRLGVGVPLLLAAQAAAGGGLQNVEVVVEYFVALP